jgi:hypothetical protein
MVLRGGSSGRYPQLRKFGTNKSFVRLDRKLGNFLAAALNVDARLATSVRSIAVLLAVLASHLRALDDFMIQRYGTRRAAPSFADLVLMTHRNLVRMRRQSPQDSGHAAVDPGIKGEEEASLKSQKAAGTMLDSAKVLWFVRTKSAKLVGLTPWSGLLTDDAETAPAVCTRPTRWVPSRSAAVALTTATTALFLWLSTVAPCLKL